MVIWWVWFHPQYPLFNRLEILISVNYFLLMWNKRNTCLVCCQWTLWLHLKKGNTGIYQSQITDCITCMLSKSFRPICLNQMYCCMSDCVGMPGTDDLNIITPNIIYVALHCVCVIGGLSKNILSRLLMQKCKCIMYVRWSHAMP